EVTEHGDLLGQDAGGLAHGVLRLDRAIGLDIQDQAVQVGALLHTGGIDLVGNAAHRAEGRVQLQPADLARLVAGAAGGGGLVAHAAHHLQAHVELDVLGQGGDDVVGIDDLDAGITLDVTGGDHTPALAADLHRDLVTAVQADGDVLEVQQDVQDILLQTLDRRVLVQHAVDLGFHDGGTGNGRQQHAAKRVAERVTESALERLNHDLGAVCAELFHGDATRAHHTDGGACHSGFLRITWNTTR